MLWEYAGSAKKRDHSGRIGNTLKAPAQRPSMLETPATVADLKPLIATPATLDDVAKMAKV
ncbi:MAG: hypothetical protein ACN6PL_09045, partial [Pseudomonas putida]